MGVSTSASKRKPFRYNTRQRIQRVGTQPFVQNGRLTFEVPRVGFLAGFFVQILGGITRAGGDTGTLSERLWNIVKRFQVNINIGAAAIVDVSGYGLYLHNETQYTNFAADLGGLPATPGAPLNAELSADPAIFTLSAAAPQVNAPFVLGFFVPVAANDGKNFNMGLINCQAPEVRVTLDMQLGQIADLFSAGAVIAGTTLNNVNVDVHYLYYEVPNPAAVSFPPLVMHRLLEERTPFSNTGDITYLVPRQGNILKLEHNVIIDGVNSGLHNLYIIRINKTDDVYRESAFVNHWLSRTRYGHRLPVGQVIHDFWNSEGLPSSGDFRDVLDSEAVSTTESITNINSGAVLGVGNNFLDTVREILQVLQV